MLIILCDPTFLLLGASSIAMDSYVQFMQTWNITERVWQLGITGKKCPKAVFIHITMIQSID